MRSYQRKLLCLSWLFAASQSYAQAPLPQAGSDTVDPQIQVQTPATRDNMPNAARPEAPAPADATPQAPAPRAPNGAQGTPNGSRPAGKTSNTKKKLKRTGDAVLKTRPGAADYDKVIVGEAQTLPKNVIRVKYIFRSVNGEKGYDSAGKSSDVGASLNATGHGLLVEYGITDRWVFQLIAPFTGSNNLALNANKFKTSKAYQDQYQKFVDTVTPALIANGRCSNAADCRSKIDAGMSAAVATPVELPTGEVATVGANVPFNRAAESLILHGVEPADGKTGIGDVQFGIGYNFLDTGRNVATIGLGLRVPSGEYTDVAGAYRPVGAGFLATGILFKYDLRLSPFVISYTHQMEYALNKAKRTRSSMLDPTQLNTADPTVDDPNTPGAGDGYSNTQEIERKGVYHTGYVRVAYALGSITRWLKPMAAYAYYSYSVDPEYQSNAGLYQKKTESYTASYALSYDGLALQNVIPASVTYQHEFPVGGRNLLVATSSDYLYLNFYYKF